jgi:hypothetical protein
MANTQTTTQTPVNTATASDSGLTYSGALWISTTVMLLIMAIDVVPNKTIDFIAPAGLVLVALVTALKIRKTDLIAAVWAPMVAWFMALLTVGQLARPTAGSAKERELVLILHGLADHAWWILGATALAAVVVAIRRLR